MTRTALSVRAGELVRAAQALPTAKSADTLYEMIAAGAATLRPGVVTTLQLVDGDGVRLVAVAPSQASVSELDADHARRVLNAASRLLIRGKRAGEGSYYGLLLADTEGALGVLGLSLPPGTTVLPGIERQLLDMYATQASLALRHSVLAATVERQTATLEVAKGELVEAAKVLALGHLVSGVVHEVNNLLGTVTLRMERLLEAPPDAETAHQLRALEGHCREIGDVIGDLRRFATGGGIGRTLVDLTALLADPAPAPDPAPWW